MQCPECGSTHIRKNGKNRGKQNHICVACGRQFIDDYAAPQGYSNDVKAMCLKMYVNGMGFRGIERVTGVHHTTVICWVKQVGENLPNAYEPDSIPEVGELDERWREELFSPPLSHELETFVGSKKTKSGSGLRLTTSNKGS